MSAQRTGKATAELFEQVILRRLGARDPDVLVGPRHGVDVGVVRVADGVAMALTTDPVFVVPGLRLGARGLVRRAHPRVRRRHERVAAAVDGGRPEPPPRDLRRGPDGAVGCLLPGVRRPRDRGRDRTHRPLRRLRVADGGRGHLPGARPRRCVRDPHDGTLRRRGRRDEGRGDRGHGALRGHVPGPARRRRRHRRSWRTPTPCSRG